VLIVPTYNECENIEVLVSRVRKSAGNEPILFIDDNSPDGTAEEIRRMQGLDGCVHLMARPGKGGYGGGSPANDRAAAHSPGGDRFAVRSWRRQP
jgi:dolichol-phosphate mannosyltransferase